MEGLNTYQCGRHDDLCGIGGPIDARAKLARSMFVDCRVDCDCPDELTAKRPPASEIPAYSSSAGAMYLNSLALALSPSQKSPMAPGMRAS
jgi:hypothetical protein